MGQVLLRAAHSKRVWGALGLLIVLGAVVAGWVAWNDELRWQFRPRRFTVVEPGSLYRSGQIAPRLIRDVLEEHRIDLVVWLLHYDERREVHQAEKRILEELGVERLNLHLRGNGTGDVEHYAEAIAAIHGASREGKRVLVHCAAGSRRTGGVVAMYQLLVAGHSPEAAYEELARFNSSRAARKHLASFLNRRMGELVESLVRRGVLDRVPSPLPSLPSEE